MILRENANYKSSFSKSGAILILKKAEEFLKIAKSAKKNIQSLHLKSQNEL